MQLCIRALNVFWQEAQIIFMATVHRGCSPVIWQGADGLCADTGMLSYRQTATGAFKRVHPDQNVEDFREGSALTLAKWAVGLDFYLKKYQYSYKDDWTAQLQKRICCQGTCKAHSARG